MREHYIFDFDGVISDSLCVAIQEINRIASIAFPTLPKISTRNDLATLYCGPLKTCLRRFGLSDSEAVDFFDQHSAAMRARSEEIAPFDEVLRMVAQHAHGKCSIVTSSYSSAVTEILSKSSHYKSDMFFSIRGREIALPKSRKLSCLIDELQLDASDVLHFGDMVSDFLYSKDANIPFCAVGWGYHPLDYLLAFNPDYFAATPDQLKRFFSE